VWRWARDIGCAVGLHGEDSRARKDGMTRSPRKWNAYYAPVIKQFNLQPDAVPGYPAPILTRDRARTGGQAQAAGGGRQRPFRIIMHDIDT
jgi:hypothetical protein